MGVITATARGRPVQEGCVPPPPQSAETMCKLKGDPLIMCIIGALPVLGIWGAPYKNSAILAISLTGLTGFRSRFSAPSVNMIFLGGGLIRIATFVERNH